MSDSLLAERVETAGWTDLMRACPDGLAAGLGLSVTERAGAMTSLANRIPVAMFNRSSGWRTPEDWKAALARHRESRAEDYFLQPLPDAGATFAGWALAEGLVLRSR